MTRTYRIHRGRDVYLAAFSAVWFAIVVGTAIHNAPRHWTAGTFASAVFALLFALVPAFGYALTPRDVTVYDDGTLEFRSPLRTRTIRAQRITSITFDEGEVELRHDRGKISMVPTNDFEEFLARLRELNPAIK